MHCLNLIAVEMRWSIFFLFDWKNGRWHSNVGLFFNSTNCCQLFAFVFHSFFVLFWSNYVLPIIWTFKSTTFFSNADDYPIDTSTHIPKPQKIPQILISYWEEKYIWMSVFPWKYGKYLWFLMGCSHHRRRHPHRCCWRHEWCRCKPPIPQSSTGHQPIMQSDSTFVSNYIML